MTPCRGKRHVPGPMVGLCIACARQTDRPAKGLEPAAKLEGGVYRCPNYVQVVPVPSRGVRH